MDDFKQPDVEQANMLLRPIMPDKFRIIYIPDMPRIDLTPARWFQVIFIVGPGDNAVLRSKVHELFPRMLCALSPVPLVSESDFISLRARRIFSDPNSTPMFIEAEWSGSCLQKMRLNKNFSVWSGEFISYQNRFDLKDPLTKPLPQPYSSRNSAIN